MWICHGQTHLGSMDEYLDEFFDTRWRLQDGVPLEELLNQGIHGSAILSVVSHRWVGDGCELT